MRLIDADTLIKTVEGLQDCYNGFSDTYDKACIIGVIDEQPTIDAVPVVRCRECVHYIKHDKRCEIWNHGGLGPSGFCFLGVRRQE